MFHNPLEFHILIWKLNIQVFQRDKIPKKFHALKILGKYNFICKGTEYVSLLFFDLHFIGLAQI